MVAYVVILYVTVAYAVTSFIQIQSVWRQRSEGEDPIALSFLSPLFAVPVNPICGGSSGVSEVGFVLCGWHPSICLLAFWAVWWCCVHSKIVPTIRSWMFSSNITAQSLVERLVVGDSDYHKLKMPFPLNSHAFPEGDTLMHSTTMKELKTLKEKQARHHSHLQFVNNTLRTTPLRKTYGWRHHCRLKMQTPHWNKELRL